jgi:hypothetical protein
MEWAKLVLDFIGGIAWPLVVVVLGLNAKPLIKGAVERVRRLKAAGAEIELDAVPRPPQLPPPPEQKALPAPKNNPPPQLEPEQPSADPELLRFAPAGAVVSAWGKLEQTMKREAIRLEVMAPNETYVVPGSVMARLADAGAIGRDAIETVEGLRKVRNDIAHHHAEIAVDAAIQYIQTANVLIGSIELGSDRVRLERMLAQLRVKNIGDVRVGRLSASGVGATPEVAREMASNRRGMWSARAGAVRMMISERDAAVLVRVGAQLEPDIESITVA